MSLDIIAAVWEAMSSHIDLHERVDAADTLINLLIDHDYEADDIKSAFRGEKEILKALKGYAETHDVEEYEDIDDDVDDDEWD